MKMKRLYEINILGVSIPTKSFLNRSLEYVFTYCLLSVKRIVGVKRAVIPASWHCWR